MKWVRHDGGRKEAGYMTSSGDCVTRAIAIASGLPYQTVLDGLAHYAQFERPRRGQKRSDGRRGVYRYTYQRYLLEDLGAEWVPTMGIGTGCTVHMREDELPMGRLVVSLSKHLAAVVDRVVYDIYDPTRNGTRCVYGYYVLGG